MDQQQDQKQPIVSIALFAVESSQLALAGYDAATQTLAIGFKGNDRVYHYKNVPQGVFDAFLDSPSKGKFFYAHIKPTYGYVRIEADGEVSKVGDAAPKSEQSAPSTDPALNEQQAA